MSDESRLRRLAHELSQARGEHCFPPRIRNDIRRIAEESLALLFPHFSDTPRCLEEEIEKQLESLEHRLSRLLSSLQEVYPNLDPGLASQYLDAFPAVHQALTLDARAIYHGDPAARSIDEVILTYPGFYAIAIFRLAHRLHVLGCPLVPRLLTEYAHHTTGIDIHPGATVGRGFFIDHGTGVVVGETTTIGNNVKLYQGVTLGALAVEKSLQGTRRHPTIGDNVIVYANATILGGDTVVGHDSIVAGNAWITESVPPFSIVGRHSEVRPRKPGAPADIEFHI